MIDDRRAVAIQRTEAMLAEMEALTTKARASLSSEEVDRRLEEMKQFQEPNITPLHLLTNRGAA